MSKVREVFKELGEVEQHLRIAERKLHHLRGDRRSFTTNMLKFGFATWVFGLAVFFLVIMVVGVKLFAGDLPIWTSFLVGIPLLVGGSAAPVAMTAMSVRKFDIKVERLRRIRSGLAVKYQRALYQYQMASLQYLKRRGLKA